MRRPGKMIMYKPITEQDKSAQFGPWNQAIQILQNQQQIPSYRKQIFQNYINNHNYKHNTPISILCCDIHPNKNQLKNITSNSINSKNRRKSCNISRYYTDKKQEQNEQQDKLFQQFLENRKKSNVKVHVVNVGNQLFLAQNQIRRQRVINNHDQKRKFTQKLRLKKQLAVSKNTNKKQKKQNPRNSLTDIFKNSHIQHLHSSIQTSPSKTFKKPQQPFYCRLSSLQKRSSSAIQRTNSKIRSFFN